jgi:hypothetical protein
MATSDLPGDINQAKKRQRIDSFSDNQTPPTTPSTQYSMPAIGRGMELTPQMQAERAQGVQRQAMGQRLTETRETIGSAVGNAASAVGKGYGLMADITTTVPRAVFGVTRGIAERGITFDSNLPGQEWRDRNRAMEAKNFVRNNPEQAASAKQYGQDVSDRTRIAGLMPGQPSPMAMPSTSAAPVQGAPVPGSAAQPPANSQPTQSVASQSATQAPEVQQGTQAIARTLPNNAQPGEYGNVGYGGIVGRRNEQGVQEFSNMQGDVDSAAGRRFADPGSNVGNGRGGLSITSGETVDNINRATDTMREARQQAVLERQNPNPVTVIRDGTRSGMEGQMNRMLNDRDAGTRAQRTADQQDRVQKGRDTLSERNMTRNNNRVAEQQAARQEQRSQLNDQLTEQSIAQGALEAKNQGRLQDLQSRMADPSLSEEERSLAERSFQALTVSGKDRYMLQDVILDRDPMGTPIIGRVALDTLTGQQVSQPPRTVTRSEAKAKAEELGITLAEVVLIAERNGIRVEE